MRRYESPSAEPNPTGNMVQSRGKQDAHLAAVASRDKCLKSSRDAHSVGLSKARRVSNVRMSSGEQLKGRKNSCSERACKRTGGGH